MCLHTEIAPAAIPLLLKPWLDIIDAEEKERDEILTEVESLSELKLSGEDWIRNSIITLAIENVADRITSTDVPNSEVFLTLADLDAALVENSLLFTTKIKLEKKPDMARRLARVSATSRILRLQLSFILRHVRRLARTYGEIRALLEHMTNEAASCDSDPLALIKQSPAFWQHILRLSFSRETYRRRLLEHISEHDNDLITKVIVRSAAILNEIREPGAQALNPDPNTTKELLSAYMSAIPVLIQWVDKRTADIYGSSEQLVDVSRK